MTEHNKYFYEFDRNRDINVMPLDFNTHLDMVANKVVNMLKDKNAAYGNTALNPPKIFSKLNSREAICARLDDKLSRIQNKGINDLTEDTVNDIIGYLLLLKMSLNRE